MLTLHNLQGVPEDVVARATHIAEEFDKQTHTMPMIMQHQTTPHGKKQEKEIANTTDDQRSEEAEELPVESLQRFRAILKCLETPTASSPTQQRGRVGMALLAKFGELVALWSTQNA